MENEIYEEIGNERSVTYINSRTLPMFKEMLNKCGNETKVGMSSYKYGDAIFKLDRDGYFSLFNRWVTACIEKGIMERNINDNCIKNLEWSQELSEVERAFQGMEVLKEIL